MPKKLCSIDKLIDFISICAEMDDSEYLYRGQAKKSWPIESSAIRFLKKLYPVLTIDSKIIDEYEEALKDGVKDYTSVRDNILCGLQHFGGRTNLIDFTKSSLVALYFSCESHHDTDDGIVYIINMKYFKRKENSQIDSIVMSDYNDKLGVAIELGVDQKNSAWARVNAQKGYLIKSPNGLMDKNDDRIQSIIIKKESKNNILIQLKRFLIDKYTIYPDLINFIANQEQHIGLSFKDHVFKSVLEILNTGKVKELDVAIQSLSALSLCQKLDENDKVRILALKSHCLLTSGKSAEAIGLLDTMKQPEYIIESLAEEDRSAFIIPSFLKGKGFLSQKRYDKAIDNYEKALSIVCTFPIRFQNKERIDALIEERIDALVNDVRKDYAIAIVENNEGDIEKAKSILKKCAGCVDSNIAELYIKCGDYDSALKILADAPEDDFIFSLEGKCWLEKFLKYGNKEYISNAITYFLAAIKALRKKKIKNPEKVHERDFHSHYYDLGESYRLAGQTEEAIKAFENLENEPFEDANAIHQIARIYMARGAENLNLKDYELAIVKYFLSIEKNDILNNASNFNDIGNIIFDIYKYIEKKNEEPPMYCNFKIEFTNRCNKFLNDTAGYPNSMKENFTKLQQHVSESLQRIDLLYIAENFFYLSKKLNDDDDYASRKLGEIYESLYNENKEIDFINKALIAYNHARYAFFQKNYTDDEGIVQKIKRLCGPKSNDHE